VAVPTRQAAEMRQAWGALHRTENNFGLSLKRRFRLLPAKYEGKGHLKPSVLPDLNYVRFVDQVVLHAAPRINGNARRAIMSGKER